MPFDRVAETTTTTGTGPLTLAGALVGYRTFASVYTPGDPALVHFTIEGVDGSGAQTGEWEVGDGFLALDGTLTRDSVYASSNAGNLVNFSAGTKRVFAAASVAAVDNVVTGYVSQHVAAPDPHGDRAYVDGLVVPVERGVGDEWVWRAMMSATVDPLPLVRAGSGSASIAVVDPGAVLGFGAVRLSSGPGAGSIYSIFQLGAQSRIRTGLLMRVRFTPQLASAQAQRISGFFDVNARNGAGFFFTNLNVVARAGTNDGTQTSTTYALSAGTPYILETEVLSSSEAKFSVFNGLTGALLWTETVTGVSFPAVGVRVWAWGSSHISAPGVATVLDDLHDYGFGTRIGYDVHRKGPQ